MDKHEVVLGKSLYDKLGGSLTAAGLAPDTLTVRMKRTREGRQQVDYQRLRIVGLLRNQSSDRIYLSAGCAARLDDWATHRRDSLDGTTHSPTDGLRFPFCHVYVPVEEDERVAGECEGLDVQAEPAGVLDICDQVQPVAFTVHRYDGAGLDDDDYCRCAFEFWYRGVSFAGDLLPPELRGDITREGSGACFSQVSPGWSCPNGTVFAALARSLGKHGLMLQPAEHVSVRRLVRYKIRDGEQPGGGVDDRLVFQLRMAQPTFAAVRPYLAFPGRFCDEQPSVTVVASDRNDPARYAADLIDGGWLGDESAYEVVLPQASAPRARIGDQMELSVERENSSDAMERVSLPLKVVGIVEDGDAVVPLPLAANVTRWLQGKLLYDTTTHQFTPPAAVAARVGHVRCTLIADGFESVPTVVSWFRQRGYRTVDQLEAHDGLLRLARVLVLLVGLAVVGCVLNGAITVLITTLMSIRAKTFEIGILRAHGFRTGEVLTIFLLQALILAILALMVAAAVVYVAEPMVRDLICGAAGIQATAFVATSPFSRAVWWLFPVAAVIAITFSVAGVTVPAIWACRLSPVAALRRRE